MTSSRRRAAAFALFCLIAISARAGEIARTDVAILGLSLEVKDTSVTTSAGIAVSIQTAFNRLMNDAVPPAPGLSVAAELYFAGGGILPTGEATSIARRIQDVVAGPVVAGLHSLAASNLGGEEAPDEDALVCGDDPAAKAIVLELAAALTSGRALDAGPLASARALEGMTAVILNVNRRYRAHAGLRLTGLR